jgi:hypothetical protein
MVFIVVYVLVIGSTVYKFVSKIVTIIIETKKNSLIPGCRGSSK